MKQKHNIICNIKDMHYTYKTHRKQLKQIKKLNKTEKQQNSQSSTQTLFMRIEATKTRQHVVD